MPDIAEDTTRPARWPRDAFGMERGAFHVLMDLVTAYGPKAPELELMIEAIDVGLPGFVARTLQLRDEQTRAHLAEVAARTALDEEKRAARRAETLETSQHTAAWQARIDAGLLDEIDAWVPAEVPVPELAETWWLFVDNFGVSGHGATPREAVENGCVGLQTSDQYRSAEELASAYGGLTDVLARFDQFVDGHRLVQVRGSVGTSTILPWLYR